MSADGGTPSWPKKGERCARRSLCGVPFRILSSAARCSTATPKIRRVTSYQTANLLTIRRTLVERIILTPEDGTLKIDLRGALAGILAVATNTRPGPLSGTGSVVSGLHVSLVAGIGFEPMTFRL